jgi:hypothetical protein
MVFNKNELIPLKEYEEKYIKEILKEAIKENIKLYIYDGANNDYESFIDEREGNYFEYLLPAQIEKIRADYPSKVFTVIKRVRYNECRLRPCKVSINRNIGIDDLWVSDREIQAFITNAETVPSNKKISESAINYSTPLMRIMYKAIEKFWLNHDPNNPPPKAEIIIDWLIKQEIEISSREATAIDMIIRPSRYKKGGNKAQVKPLKSVKI